MSQRTDAVADDLRSLAANLKSLLESATTDPKERAKRERQWRVLYGVLALAFTLVGRKLAAKAWGILTGEEPPTKRRQPPPVTRPPVSEPQQETAPTQ